MIYLLTYLLKSGRGFHYVVVVSDSVIIAHVTVFMRTDRRMFKIG